MLDTKMAELQQIVDPEEFDSEPVDLDIDLEEIVEAPTVEEVTEQEIPLEEPEVITVADRAEEVAKPTINDSMAAGCAWLKDMPGAPVRDIRSAISLNDRVIFINMLFNEDAQAFVNALTSINAMETLDEAIGFITSEFPSWDMNSELVYRFMMAVRRKVK